MALPRTTLEQWAVLAAVVDQGGFAQAAIALNRSQSAVSYAVSRLQDALEVPLLVVEGRKSVLTAHGQTLLTRARALLQDLDTLEQLARSLKQGWEPELKLVVDAAFPRPRLLQIVAELQQSCPSTQIQLADVVLSGAEDAITAGSADLVVTSRVPAGFLGDWLLDVRFVAVAHPDHGLFRLKRELVADDLVHHVQAVVRDSGAVPRDEGWLGAERRFTVSSMEASLATIQAGLAYAWLPEHLVADLLQEQRLRRLPLATGGTRNVSLHMVSVRPELLGPAGRTAVAAFQLHARPLSHRQILPTVGNACSRLRSLSNAAKFRARNVLLLGENNVVEHHPADPAGSSSYRGSPGLAVQRRMGLLSQWRVGPAAHHIVGARCFRAAVKSLWLGQALIHASHAVSCVCCARRRWLAWWRFSG
jgi:DNA-binding transcriptional LysR family regulator